MKKENFTTGLNDGQNPKQQRGIVIDLLQHSFLSWKDVCLALDIKSVKFHCFVSLHVRSFSYWLHNQEVILCR